MFYKKNYTKIPSIKDLRNILNSFKPVVNKKNCFTDFKAFPILKK